MTLLGSNTQTPKSWKETFMAFTHPRVVTMLFLGLSAGIPILLIFSSLSLWLREAGVERSAVTFFSWAALGYSFKFVWAPLIDQIPLPFLTKKLGRRRGWLLVSQLMIILAILGMAFTDPSLGQAQLTTMALAAVLLGFSSATQDIVIDAYRIEAAEKELQAILSSTYIAGYRIGMLLAGAGALYLASNFGSTAETYLYSAWRTTYSLMAVLMLVGICTTFLIPEPDIKRNDKHVYPTKDYLRFLGLFLIAVLGFIGCFYITSTFDDVMKSYLTEVLANKKLAGFLVETLRLSIAIAVALGVAFAGVKQGVVKRDMVIETYINPVLDFFRRYGLQLSLLLLALIALYRISDIVMGVIANVFYLDIGFTKIEIAAASKTYGLFMTIAGGFLGGILSVRYGVMRILFLGALLSALTNLLFTWLATVGHSMPMLYLVISADNLSAGLASAAFIAFLSSLTNISFTAMQYAIFGSLMTLFPKLLGGYSGTMVDSMGYPSFFMLTAVMGIPVLFIIIVAARRLEVTEQG